MVSVIVPIYKALKYLPSLMKSLNEQTISHELILVSSGFDEETESILAKSAARVVYIKKEDFNHGRTRNLGVSLASNETVIFLTQDALPASETTLEVLVRSLYGSDNNAMAYGRQLPREDSDPFGTYARLINYPEKSLIKDKSLIPKMGIRTCSCSNSFAAYKKKFLVGIGGFPETTILGEDVSVAARFILNGKSVAYAAEATVYHSHNYTVFDEFKRYFDIGAFHEDQKDVLRPFNQAEYEGIKYMINESKYLIENGYFFLIPQQFIRLVAKYAGYKLGRVEKNIPLSMKRRISMHSTYWQ